jgi:hypothetical protein
LTKIDLNISPEVNPELVINSLREIKLQGLERIKLVNLVEKNEIFFW